MNFRTNIKLSFEQWKFRKLQFIFLAVQIIFSFLLVCFIFQQFFSNGQLMSQMQKYMGTGDIYVLWNNNEPEWEQELEKDKYNRKFRKLINKARTANADILVLNNEYETSIKEKSTNLLYVTPDFFDRYGITGDFSDREIHELFCTRFVENIETEKLLPAIAGADFQHEYKKGDIIQEDSGEQYRIVGFLKKGSYYAVPTQSRNLENMDHTLLVPVTVDLSDNVSIMEYLRYSQFTVKDRSELLGIEDMNRELHLMDSYFVSYSSQLQIVQNDILESIILFGGFGSILFIFSMLGISGMIIQLIHDYQYEYGVNLLCGAEIKDIFIRLVFQVSLLIVTGVCMAFFMAGNRPAFWSVFLMAVVCLLMLYFYSWKKLNRETVIISLRSME